jgi:hypothetical protein
MSGTLLVGEVCARIPSIRVGGGAAAMMDLAGAGAAPHLESEERQG